jgi:hypothetical protein
MNSYLKNEFNIKILISLKIDMSYFNQLLHNLSNQFFKNLMLLRFKRIEANYLYVYQTNFIKSLLPSRSNFLEQKNIKCQSQTNSQCS